MVKLVDAGDSKSPAARRAGSIPAPGTTDKAGSFHELPAFFFFPMGSGFDECANVRRSVPESGGRWGYKWGYLLEKWGYIATCTPNEGRTGWAACLGRLPYDTSRPPLPPRMAMP